MTKATTVLTCLAFSTVLFLALGREPGQSRQDYNFLRQFYSTPYPPTTDTWACTVKSDYPTPGPDLRAPCLCNTTNTTLDAKCSAWRRAHNNFQQMSYYHRGLISWAIINHFPNKSVHFDITSFCMDKSVACVLTGCACTSRRFVRRIGAAVVARDPSCDRCLLRNLRITAVVEMPWTCQWCPGRTEVHFERQQKLCEKYGIPEWRCSAILDDAARRAGRDMDGLAIYRRRFIACLRQDGHNKSPRLCRWA